MVATPVTENGVSAAGRTASVSGGGPVLYVDSVHGQTGNTGGQGSPFATMQAAFTKLTQMNAVVSGSASNGVIYVNGDIREQIVAPLGVYGVKIIGMFGGNPRNVTASGVVLAGNGAAWREPASATASTPLLTLREQGWEIHNMLFLPDASQVAVRLRRQEDATYPDASHARFVGVRFFGNASLGTATGQGIDDYGGQYNVSVEGCQFVNLEYGIYASNVAIAAPLQWKVGEQQPNIFQLCKHDILTNASGWVVGPNQHLTAYNASTHPNTLNLANTGTGTYLNRIAGPLFQDATADIVVAKGYKPGNASDSWRFYSTNTAAYGVTTPT